MENVSARRLRDRGVFGTVQAALRDSGLPPPALVLVLVLPGRTGTVVLGVRVLTSRGWPD